MACAAAAADGYTVYVPASPFRGLTFDPAYLADFLQSISGPIVLVGHSYGGAVITNAATGNPKVKALVYVDALHPGQGQTIGQLVYLGARLLCRGDGPDHHLQPRDVPRRASGEFDAYVKQNVFPACFANGLPPREARGARRHSGRCRPARWARRAGVPSLEDDPVLGRGRHRRPGHPPALQLAMARHAHARITKVARRTCP